ncbi:oxidoreductase [Planotetraspora silvatica]|uniref:Oxidoreductase n=1 Tax=Planotetraspora silvatica TaxID=234614 RepID=A0A8J3UKM9_9ACTN|nr:Gfo/Idh/MocA family oxidoreductase [Planotetraspora silvatica]GII47578.1 oxidoreductase [Planotetraspora silvatica]
MSSPETPIRIGIVGTGFIARAHAEAYRRVRDLGTGRPVELASVASRRLDNARSFADRHGIRDAMDDWRGLVGADVDLVDVCTPNDSHVEIAGAAIDAGHDVVCEKPLGRDATEARGLADRVEASTRRLFCVFNYRFVPAVALIAELVRSGEFGDLHGFRFDYSQDWGLGEGTGWKFDGVAAGSGSVGDLGSHAFDLLRALVGPIDWISARTTTVAPGRSVDDAFVSLVTTVGGVSGTVSSSRVVPGAKNRLALEITGTRGAVSWNLERLNEITVVRETPGGFERTTRLVTRSADPSIDRWWPEGHVLGWEAAMFGNLAAVIETLSGRADWWALPPADHRDGLAAALAVDATLASAADATAGAATVAPVGGES